MRSYTEKILEELGLEYVEKDVALEDIDIDKSLALYQIRDETINPLIVSRYARDMLRDEEFPPIVVHEDGSSILVDAGLTRVKAAEQAAKTTINSFVLIDPTPLQLRLLRARDNAAHGQPLSENERKRVGVELVMHDNVTTSDAARMMNVERSSLKGLIDEAKARKRVGKLYPKALERIAPSVVTRMGDISLDATLKHVAEAVVATGASSAQVRTLVTRVNKAKNDEGEQRAIVKAFRQDLAKQIKATAGGSVATPRSVAVFRRGLSTLEAVLANDGQAVRKFISDQLSDGDKTELREQIAKVTALLGGVAP